MSEKSGKCGVFITGTDTGVGKTFVSSLILSALQSAGLEAGYFKPLQTGMDSDCDSVQELGRLPGERIARPVYSYPEPMAPYRAASLRQESISIQMIRRCWARLPDQAWVVEGAGGLLVPLNKCETIRELIIALRLPLLLVASTRLGTINHTLLSLEAASKAGLQVSGVVLVGEEDRGLSGTLREISSIPVLAEIPRFASVSPRLVQQVASEYFGAETLARLFLGRGDGGGR